MIVGRSDFGEEKTSAGNGSEDLNPFHIAAQQFDRAAPELKHGLIDFLKRPARSVILEFPIELEDGSVSPWTKSVYFRPG